MRGSRYAITDRAATFASHLGWIRALLVMVQSLTVLKVLEAFILDSNWKGLTKSVGLSSTFTAVMLMAVMPRSQAQEA